VPEQASLSPQVPEQVNPSPQVPEQASPSPQVVPDEPGASPPPFQASSTLVEAEDMQMDGQYAAAIDSPFDGVALYANDDSVSFDYTLPAIPGAYRVEVTGASSDRSSATAEVLLDDRALGTLTFRETDAAVEALEFEVSSRSPDVRTLTVNVIGDDDTWDLFIDQIEIILIDSSE
jgi:hypothetical protein